MSKASLSLGESSSPGMVADKKAALRHRKRRQNSQTSGNLFPCPMVRTLDLESPEIGTPESLGLYYRYLLARKTCC